MGTLEKLRQLKKAESIYKEVEKNINKPLKPQALKPQATIPPQITTPVQPIQSNFIDSYLKPIKQTVEPEEKTYTPADITPRYTPAIIPNKLPKEATPNVKTGFFAGGRPIGDGKGNITYDNSPLQIIGEQGNSYIIKEKDGSTNIVNKRFVSDYPLNEMETPGFIQNAGMQSDIDAQNYQAQQYANRNPVDRFLTKATDIGFRGDTTTPSLGNPVADVGANIVGNIMSLATPTGQGSLGGAMNAAGDRVEAGLQK